MLNFFLTAWQFRKNIKPAHIAMVLILGLSGCTFLQSATIDRLKASEKVLKEELAQAKKSNLSNSRVIDSLTNGSWQTVNQLQAANRSCQRVLAWEKKRNSIIESTKKDYEKEIKDLNQRILNSGNACANADIPAGLLE
jgi:hypothetical protein